MWHCIKRDVWTKYYYSKSQLGLYNCLYCESWYSVLKMVENGVEKLKMVNDFEYYINKMSKLIFVYIMRSE